MKAKQLLCSSNYKVQTAALKLLQDKRELSLEAAVAMILNAPDLDSLRYYLEAVDTSKFQKDTMKACMEAFVQFLTQFDFSSAYFDHNHELSALSKILRANKSHLNVQDCVCLILNNDR